VGVGVRPSGWSGAARAGQRGTKASFSTPDNAGTQVGNNYYYNGSSYIYLTTAAACAYQQSGGIHTWFNASSGTAGNAISFTQAMTLDVTGSLTVPNIYTNTTASVTYVAVSSAGLLQRGGVSALKYKQDIRNLESIDINKFRPVRYKSKCENDDQTIDYFGFIADEVEEAGIKELITYNDSGEPEGFQYERMTVVLLKAIQELTKRLEALELK